MTYHYSRDYQPVGPATEDELTHLLQTGGIVDTLILPEGAKQWARYGDIFAPPPPQPLAQTTANVAAPIPPIPRPPAIPAKDAFAHAGFWLRFAACLVDFFILLVSVSVICLLLTATASDADRKDVDSIYTPVANLIWWLYYAISQSSSWQATIGQKLLGLKVVGYDGRRISFGRATGRFFAMYLSALIFLVGFVMIAFTHYKQALHDLIAQTFMVKTQDT